MHQIQKNSTFKIAHPDFSFIDLKDFRNFKDFFKNKNSNPHIFLIFEDSNSIFYANAQDNDPIQ